MKRLVHKGIHMSHYQHLVQLMLVRIKVQRCVRLVSYIASGLVPDGLVCIIFNRSVLHHAISLHIFSQLVKEVLVKGHLIFGFSIVTSYQL